MSGGRPKAQYSQALRLLQVVELLQHRRQLTIAQLMEQFGINRRTVQRDIAVLTEHYAVEEGDRTRTGEKTFRLRPGSRTETLKLTLTEMMSLYMGRNLFAFMEGTDLEKAMNSLYEKLQTRLCARNATVKESLPKKLYCTTGFPKAYGASDDVLNDVLTGLIEEKKVAITYQRPGRTPYEDTVHPYSLVLHNHALYLLCFSERADARRMLAVERILASKWRGVGRFAYPEDFDPETELASAFGISAGEEPVEVRLEFSSEVAPYVLSRRWHASMRSEGNDDGSVVVTMDVVVGEELLHWITGYGGEVRVLGPNDLRERVTERHRSGLPG